MVLLKKDKALRLRPVSGGPVHGALRSAAVLLFASMTLVSACSTERTDGAVVGGEPSSGTVSKEGQSGSASTIEDALRSVKERESGTNSSENASKRQPGSIQVVDNETKEVIGAVPSQTAQAGLNPKPSDSSNPEVPSTDLGYVSLYLVIDSMNKVDFSYTAVDEAKDPSIKVHESAGDGRSEIVKCFDPVSQTIFLDNDVACQNQTLVGTVGWLNENPGIDGDYWGVHLCEFESTDSQGVLSVTYEVIFPGADCVSKGGIRGKILGYSPLF